MDKQYCPMCGRPNQSDAEECEFCHARLIPLGNLGKDFTEELGSPSNEQEDTEREPEVPEWLSDLRKHNAKLPEENENPEISAGKEELPEWLNFINQRTTSNPPAESAVPLNESFEVEVSPEQQVESTVQPPKNIKTHEDKASPKIPLQEERQTGTDLPEWLQNMAGKEWDEERGGAEYFGSVIPPFINIDESLIESELQEAGTKEEALPPNLPDQSKEESGGIDFGISEDVSASSESLKTQPESSSLKEEKKIEVAGPLAGFSDILPVEPFVAEGKESINVLANLLISEKQKQQAELFEKLITEERTPKTSKSKPLERSNPFLRILIFLGLLTAAILGLFYHPFPNKPTEMDVGVLDARQTISNVSERSPVLVIVDYEAGDFAEMQSIGFGLIDQLMVNGAYLVLLSTDPLGPLQADRLIRQTNQIGEHQYQEEVNWVNLGYLSGATTGIQKFIQSPQSTIPLFLNGQDIWSKKELQNIHRVSDFSLVVLLTENASNARNWIEQLNGKIPSKKIVFLVSAQIEPVVQPYYAAVNPQMRGLVAGINGGAFYETQAGRNGLALEYWNGYSWIVTLSIVLILIGALVNLLWNYKSSGSGKGEGI